MKIIFLDFDGVLNAHKNIRAPTWAASRHPFIWIDKELVAKVAQIVEATQAKICISSTWRMEWGAEGCKDILNYEYPGLGDNVIGETEVLSTLRGIEINKWLSDKPDVTRYVILDDNGDMLADQLSFFVQTNSYAGITDADVQKAIGILNETV